MPLGGLVAGGIGAVGSIISGLLGSGASTKAANAQVSAEQQAATLAQQGAQNGNGLITQNTQEANNLLSNIYGTNQSLYSPYLTTGNTALTGLNAALAPGGDLTKQFTAADMEAQDPGYQFRINQGIQATQRSAAAAGDVLGGGTLKSLTDYAQGAASSEYQNAFNRFTQQQNQRYSELSGTANLGLNATNAISNAGQNFANQSSSNLTNSATNQSANLINAAGIAGNAAVGAGNARASGYVGSANAIGGGIAGVTNAAQSIAPSLLNYLGVSSSPSYNPSYNPNIPGE